MSSVRKPDVQASGFRTLLYLLSSNWGWTELYFSVADHALSLFCDSFPDTKKFKNFFLLSHRQAVKTRHPPRSTPQPHSEAVFSIEPSPKPASPHLQNLFAPVPNHRQQKSPPKVFLTSKKIIRQISWKFLPPAKSGGPLPSIKKRNWQLAVTTSRLCIPKCRATKRRWRNFRVSLTLKGQWTSRQWWQWMLTTLP